MQHTKPATAIALGDVGEERRTGTLYSAWRHAGVIVVLHDAGTVARLLTPLGAPAAAPLVGKDMTGEPRATRANLSVARQLPGAAHAVVS